MKEVDLSVIIANYNHARFLPRCLDAILSQSVRPREILVIDDASTDGSHDLLQSYAARNSNMSVIHHDKNQGAVPTYQHGLALSRGRYLFLGASDDYVLPGFFEKSVSTLEQHQHAGLCCGYDSHAYGYEGDIREFPTRWSEGPTYFSPQEVIRLVRRNLASQATVVRRDAFVKIGGYRPELEWYCDWFGYLAIAFRQGICHIPESLAVRTLGLPGAYSNESQEHGTEKHIGVLGVMIDVLMRPDFADVAPMFRRNGAISIFGTDLIRAAARREDRWHADILGLLNAFTREQYQGLLGDPDPRVRELAEFFLGPFWKEEHDRHEAVAAELAFVKKQLPPEGALAKVGWAARKVTSRLSKIVGLKKV